MNQINTKQLLLYILIPTTAVSLSYLMLGHFSPMPHLLLFCILGTVTLVPIELGFIFSASKKEFGSFSLKSAFTNQVKMPFWQILLIVFLFFSLAGLLSITVAPLENSLLAPIRQAVLNKLPVGFDWQNKEYVRTFSKPILIVTCIYYGIFNVIIGPITEELFFRGYLTSHYKKQSAFTPILIVILFSLYHFWLPFNNIFRILVFGPVAFVSYKKKNIYVSMFFHCMSNLFSVVGFIIEVMK